ncbi:MAG: HPr family phosphocarrier protein [Victivallaceae bacterium]
MIEKNVKIHNKAGIHCRPSSVILNTINVEYPNNTFYISAFGQETELNSILSLISLGMQYGDKATLKVDGPDAEVACEKIASLLEFEYDFPPRT